MCPCGPAGDRTKAMRRSAAVEGIVMFEKEFGRKVGKVTDIEDSW